jgi:hypothetical protein
MCKADNIINKYNNDKLHFYKNIKAGICPICESLLLLKDYTYNNIVKKGLIFKKEVIETIIYKKVICPNGHNIIAPDYGDVSDPGWYCWENTLNKEIRNYHIMNYGDGDETEW